jgi:protein dpy-30
LLILTQGNKNSFETLPIRAYLDDTVIPLVLKALSALAQERVKPENPVEYIADYLLKHNPEDK